jgi:SAM-dependent methyltransferase
MTVIKREIENQVKSKKRVTDHGEVFTSEREVNAMLDLVKQETERIDSRFLEPACGTGNFLIEILRRKLVVVENRYKKNQLEYERYAIIAISSIYGIDLLQDNVEEARIRLFNIFNKKYTCFFSDSTNPDYLKSVKFILTKNIILGDALTLKTVGLLEEPIIFSEWSLVLKNKLQRRDYKMTSLLENQPLDGLNLFSDLGEEAFIPVPVKTFPLQSIYKLAADVQIKL